jgi:hypothetical protein
MILIGDPTMFAISTPEVPLNEYKVRKNTNWAIFQVFVYASPIELKDDAIYAPGYLSASVLF